MVEVSFGAGVKALRDSHVDLISGRALPEPGWPLAEGGQSLGALAMTAD